MSEPVRPPIIAGAAPEERDPSHWLPEALSALQRILDRSPDTAGQAVRDTFSQPERQMTVGEFVAFWNGSRLKAMATVGARGPHIAPVHAEFVNGRLRSTIYENAVRRRDLRTNPEVALTTWGPNGAAAIVYGRAREVPNSSRETRPGATGVSRRTVALDIEVTRIYAMKARPAECTPRRTSQIKNQTSPIMNSLLPGASMPDQPTAFAAVKDSPETIPIRDGEDFDHARLATYLRGQLPHSERPLEVVQFAGGHANLTYLLRYGDAEYVLRRPPVGPVAPTAHDMGREYRVLSVLYNGYPLAPRAYVYCEDSSVIGAPFFVMERRCGTVVRRTIPEQFGGGRDAAINRRISEVVVDTLADLHDVDQRTIGLSDLGKPDGFMQRQIEGWTARYERAKTKEIPIVGEMARWLHDNLPPAPQPTLLHNDWRLDNMMLDSTDPGRAVAVFDWDMCTVGDPFADLGTVLAAWIEASEGTPGDSQVGMPSTVPGFLTRREAVERYGKRRRIDVSAVPYYYVFGIFKIAVVLQQIYVRYHRGQTKDQRFAFFEQGAEMLFWKAQERSKTMEL